MNRTNRERISQTHKDTFADYANACNDYETALRAYNADNRQDYTPVEAAAKARNAAAFAYCTAYDIDVRTPEATE